MPDAPVAATFTDVQSPTWTAVDPFCAGSGAYLALDLAQNRRCSQVTSLPMEVVPTRRSVVVVRAIVTLMLMAMIATSCRVAADELTVDRVPPPVDPALPVAAEGLPVVGPVPGASHWHAAYVVRICDDVLAPFDSEADPLGIHSHADGVMHVHPFFEESGYESALLSHFADAMGFELRDGELTLPDGQTWQDGDLCGDTPGRVFVDRWRDPDPTATAERMFENLDEIRYLADGELYQIGFAPFDSPPVVPPSTPLLQELSNFITPSEPWVDPGPASTRDQARIWQIVGVAEEPCPAGFVSERVLNGPVRCFEPASSALNAADAIVDARAVLFNRQPAIELTMAPALIELVFGHFAQSESPLALAIEVDGFVVTAPQLARPPVSDRLIISGGMSTESAEQLAETLATE